MKNIKKVLAVMTAVSAFAASSSAFAETTVNMSGDNYFAFTKAAYEGETVTANTIKVTSLPEGAEYNEVTFLVLDYDANETNVADGDILYIDQGTNSETAAPEFVGKNLGLKVDDIVKAAEDAYAATLKENPAWDDEDRVYSYPVKLGYYDADAENAVNGFAMAKATIDVTIPKAVAEEPPVVTVTMKYGNIDCDDMGELGSKDAVAILRATVGSATKTFGADDTISFTGFTLGETYETKNGHTLKYGNIDCDDMGELGSKDAVAILRATVGSATKTFGADDTTGFAGFTLGETYEIVVK